MTNFNQSKNSVSKDDICLVIGDMNAKQELIGLEWKMPWDTLAQAPELKIESFYYNSVQIMIWLWEVHYSNTKISINIPGQHLMEDKKYYRPHYDQQKMGQDCRT